MGFFAEELSENNGVSIPIPEGHHLQITHVCLDLDQETTGPVILRAKSTNDEQEFNICILHTGSHRYHEQLNLEFGVEDSPVEFSVDGGTVHLTGNWRWDDDHEHDDEHDEDDEEEEGDEEGGEDEEEVDMDEDEIPELVPFPDDEDDSTVEEVQKKVKTDKSKSAQQEKKSSKAVSEAVSAIASEDKSNKKKRQVEAVVEKNDQPPAKKAAKSTAAAKDTAQTSMKFNLPPWHVIPETDSGLLVPNPKTITKKDGLLITDHIIGKGALPKPGAVVEILYEGLFPETGETFDHRLRRKQPFTFRRGLQHVIKGMDLGMEGMRVGGARELIIPPNLGYGAKGVGDIPGNQTLVFRIQLIGTH